MLPLTDQMRDEYRQMFDTCEIRPERAGAADQLAESICNNRARYASVGDPLSIPWFFIGVVHCMECSLNFHEHLHNGDPLTACTVRMPKGRPTGTPPFTWEQSATDSLTFQGLSHVTDWSLPGLLYQLEKYNGFGYRTTRPEVYTPYLWSFSNHYQAGKFVSDGKFDPHAPSNQCGAAVLLRSMSESKAIQFDMAGNPLSSPPAGSANDVPDVTALAPLVTYSSSQSAAAMTLQRALNTFPGIFLRVDGVPGNATSDAFHTVTGHYLQGDPRASVSS